MKFAGFVSKMMGVVAHMKGNVFGSMARTTKRGRRISKYEVGS